MTVLPRPPRGITADAFHIQYLPSLYAALTHTLPPPPFEGTFGAQVGDEAWGFRIVGGGLTVSHGLPPEALAVVTTEPGEFRAQVNDVLPELLKSLEKNLLTIKSRADAFWQARGMRIDIDALADHPGNVTLAYVDDAGDATKLAVALGNARGPTAHIETTHDVIDAIFAHGGKLSRLIGTKLRVSGEVAYVVRLVGLIEVP